nr:hypothetical protein [Tanacetum cinerariifolium]
MTIDQQVALDEALVPHASLLRIGKINFRLRSDITSKELTLQVVYDVLRLTPFYKAFLVTADVPEIYMQEFWATATVHHHSIHFKMNNKKRIVSLEYFREMLDICPRIPNQTFDELLFEEEILAFLRYLGYSGEIKMITDVNINKLHQPWRSFAAVINKCLSGKSTSYDSLRLSQAQILWGMYHKKNVDFAYLLWEDFVYQVEHKDAKKSNEMYYPRHKTLDFSKGKQPTKSSKAKGLYVLFKVALTEAEQIKLATKQSLQQTYISQASGSGTDEGTSIIPGVPEVPTDESDEEISWKSSDEDDDNDDDQDSDNDGDDFVHPKLSTHDEEAKDEESFDHIVQTPSQVENSDNESNDEECHGMNVGGDEGPDAEDDDEELYRDVKINLEGIDSLFESTHRVDVPVMTTVVPLLVTAPTLPPPSIPIISQVQQAPAPSPATAPSTSLQNLPNFGSLFGFDHRLKTLKANFSEFMQTNQFAKAISSIPDDAQAENEDFLNKLDENIHKIIKEQVKEQVKVQVSKILPKIEKTINEQLEAEVLTRASNSSKTSYVMAADISELELKKILIEKMESNKSIYQSDEQRNIYKALVDAYECDKIILDTYGDMVTLKRRRDDENKDEKPSAGSNWGSKRRRAGKEPESTSALKEKASKTSDKSTERSKSYQKTASESALAEEPMHTTLDEPSHQEFKTSTHRSIQPWIIDLAKQADSCASFNELMDTPVDFSTYLMNRLNVDTLTHELLAGPTYELMKGSCKSLVELEFFLEEVYKATTNQLDWNNPEGRQYPYNLLKPLPLIPNSRGRRVIPFDHFIKNGLEYLRGGAFSQKYTTFVTKTKAADYGHIKGANINSYMDSRSTGSLLERDDDKLYKFKEGDLKRLCIQDIKDMLLLLVQGKLTNLTIEECFAFNT